MMMMITIMMMRRADEVWGESMTFDIRNIANVISFDHDEMPRHKIISTSAHRTSAQHDDATITAVANLFFCVSNQ